MANVLLIDDDPRTPAFIHATLPAPYFSVAVALDAVGGIDRIRSMMPDVIVLGLQVAERPGVALYEQVREVAPRVPVIVLSANTTAAAAIEVMRRGAFDYLHKPLEQDALKTSVLAALAVQRPARREAAAAPPVDENSVDGTLFGACPPMLDVYKAIGRVASQDVTVLISGESGTGKELVARAIWKHSNRADAPFLMLNCAAIPEQLLESELFGHEKGAFTGADRRRIGKFEQCDGGTIVLDEVGDMPLALQAKILRLLQEQTFERVGGNETIHTDVRIIAATHRDLQAMSLADRFRPDLYYRLGVFTIHLPPLRERGGDLTLLIDHYLRKFAMDLGRDVRDVCPEALLRLQKYSWPGNIRELQSVLKRALLKAHGYELLTAFLPELVDPTAPAIASGAFDLETSIEELLAPGAGDIYAQTHLRVDRILLAKVLEYADCNQSDAARLLGITRHTLRIKARALGLQATRPAELTRHTEH